MDLLAVGQRTWSCTSKTFFSSVCNCQIAGCQLQLPFLSIAYGFLVQVACSNLLPWIPAEVKMVGTVLEVCLSDFLVIVMGSRLRLQACRNAFLSGPAGQLHARNILACRPDARHRGERNVRSNVDSGCLHEHDIIYMQGTLYWESLQNFLHSRRLLPRDSACACAGG